MRIAYSVDPEIPVPPKLYGGIERVVDMLIRRMQAKGHEVILFAHPDSSVPCQLIPFSGKESRGVSDTLRNTFTLSRACRMNIDVLHSFSRLAYLATLLPLGIPKIMSYQREPTLSQITKATKLARNGSLIFTGCSRYISDQITPSAPSFAISNGVPIEQYTFVGQVRDDAPLVFLGRIQEIKGTHIAIEVARLAGKKLVIAGNVPNEPKHQAYFDEKIKPFIDGDRVVYAGPVNDQQKNELLGKALAFLMPVQWNEPFGIVMAEALACGTPVIAFPFGACPEVVEHGRNGYLVNNIEEMIAAVHQSINISRTVCRQIAESKYSDYAIANQYELLYNRHISKEFRN